MNERPFGDDTGMEGQYTYGRTRELVHFGQNAYPMVSGGFEAEAGGPLRGSFPAWLHVDDDDFADESVGVGVLRKF